MERSKRSIILTTDSYKPSQFLQYPKNTRTVFSYIESRGGLHDEIEVFGLQPMLEFLAQPITLADINKADRLLKSHGEPFNRAGWEYILEKHQGKLPLIIRAVKEGSIVPVKNAIITVENTDPECFWLTSYIETYLMRVWYPITVATTSYKIKKIIKKYLEKTGDMSGLLFKLHDFGARGVSSGESAAIGGAAHGVNFMGSDTIEGIEYLEDFYGATEMPMYSIPASEHSTITSWGRENEFDAYANMVKVFGKSPIFACVSDSYNIWKALEMWKKLEQQIVANGQILVVRPDSGDPLITSVRCVKELGDLFGYTVNDKGYKVLNNVRVIYGDGISSPQVIEDILAALEAEKYSADNIAFGMGGGLLQKVDRDTQKFAMKCSAIIQEVDGVEVIVEVYKDPIDDHGKISKKGFQDLIKVDGKYETVQRGREPLANSELDIVFLNGEVKRFQTINEIRKLAIA